MRPGCELPEDGQFHSEPSTGEENLGLKSADGLREFCAELASDQPSPGGGSASAASGAMGASLLAMVCGITAKSKKHEADRPELQKLRLELLAIADELVALSREDALAYDAVVEAARRRGSLGEPEGGRQFSAALQQAAEVPLRTAAACARTLELAVPASRMGLKSASSDVLVGTLLAEAGLRGAAANVRINTKDLEDSGFVTSAEDRLSSLERVSRKHVREAVQGKV